MHNTEIDHIKAIQKGIFVNTSTNTDYEKMKRKIIESNRQKEEINTLKSKMASIEDILARILKKVS